MLTVACVIIVVALIFDYVNGMHDAANSIATVVSTRVLSPLQAVVMAAFFNAISLVLGTQVAATIGTGVIRPEAVNELTIFAALVGAIFWNILTWWLGLPSSSSHALIGGLVGAGIAGAGFSVLVFSGLSKAVVFIVLSPMTGFVLGMALMVATYWFFRRVSLASVDRLFRKIQLLSAAAYSFGHGSNDAQKTMGIIALVLYRYHLHSDPAAVFAVPLWSAVTCHLVIGLGTLSGGWRIVKTMGLKICKLQPVGGCCAESAGALTLLGTALFGIPVSTTHTITGAILGVGSTKRLSAVRWGVTRKIVLAWILTIPASALVSFLTYYLMLPLAKLLGIG
ncbi:MAG: inorganic phosphate transporter [Candidatus Riflebacteria bacterium]|nr:inorganic phosphate transporter [Candidatus Riflebacteria bacterium]